MRKDRRVPPPFASPRVGGTYIVRRRMAVVLQVGDRPWTDPPSRERMWPVDVLCDAGRETWAWGEYSADAWIEVAR